MLSPPFLPRLRSTADGPLCYFLLSMGSYSFSVDLAIPYFCMVASPLVLISTSLALPIDEVDGFCIQEPY